jgi:hypothetical protein
MERLVRWLDPLPPETGTYTLIDGTTCIPVMYGDRNGADGSDDDEPDEGIKDEDEGQESMPVPVTIPTPDSLVSPTTMMQSQPLQQPDPGDYYRVRTIPVRHYSHSQLEDHNAFGDGSYLSRGFQPPSPGQQDPSRRAFPSPTYQGTQNMYGWQNNMVSSGPVSTNFYMAASPQSLAPPSAPYQLPPPISQQGMLPSRVNQHQFDMQNGRYDSAPALGNQLRTGSLHHPHQLPQGFQDYLQDGGVYGQHDPELKDENGIHAS